MVLVWLGAERDAERRERLGLAAKGERGKPTRQAPTPDTPSWQVRAEEAVDAGAYQLVGKVEHIVAAHIQEIPENGPDAAHVGSVHRGFVIAALSEYAEHDWAFTWTPGDTPETSHTALVGMKLGLRVLGVPIESLMVRAHVTQMGPALVQEYLYLPLNMGEIYFASSVTPIAPLKQRYTHAMWCSPNLPRFVAKTILRALMSQVNRDVPIWNNKTFRSAPPYSRVDVNVKRFRAWYAAFYSPHSESFADAMQREREAVLEW